MTGHYVTEAHRKLSLGHTSGPICEKAVCRCRRNAALWDKSVEACETERLQLMEGSFFELSSFLGRHNKRDLRRRHHVAR